MNQFFLNFIIILLNTTIMPIKALATAPSHSDKQLTEVADSLTQLNEADDEVFLRDCKDCISLHDPDNNHCPSFLVQTAATVDKNKNWFRTIHSPQAVCHVSHTSRFASANVFEDFLKTHSLTDFKVFSPVSHCLDGTPSPKSGSSSVPLSIGQKNLILAEHYTNMHRLQAGATKTLRAISDIDNLLEDKKHHLSGVSCDLFGNLPQAKAECLSLKRCSGNNTSDKSRQQSFLPASGASIIAGVPSRNLRVPPEEESVSSGNPSTRLESSALDTLIATQAIERIDKRILNLQSSVTTRTTNRERRQARQAIEELKQVRHNIQQVHPWIRGRIFQKEYKQVKDVKAMEQLIKKQLAHTRWQLKKHARKLSLTQRCLHAPIDSKAQCKDIDIAETIAKTPTLHPSEVFSLSPLSYGNCDKFKEDYGKSSQCRTQARLLHEKTEESRSYFAGVKCLKTQRDLIKSSNTHTKDFMLELGLAVGTVGLGGMLYYGGFKGILTGRKTSDWIKRFKALGFIGLDKGLSVAYVQDALKECEASMNQLESLGDSKTDNPDRCANLNASTEHTSDVKTCVLAMTLAALPLTLPLAAGLTKSVSSGSMQRALRNIVQLGKGNISSHADRIKKAREVLGRELTPLQSQAIVDAHTVGLGEKGVDGGVARVGFYTHAQLRRKREILQKAGFSRSERRKLMKEKVVGLELADTADNVDGMGNVDIGVGEEAVAKNSSVSRNLLQKRRQAFESDLKRVKGWLASPSRLSITEENVLRAKQLTPEYLHSLNTDEIDKVIHLLDGNQIRSFSPDQVKQFSSEILDTQIPLYSSTRDNTKTISVSEILHVKDVVGVPLGVYFVLRKKFAAKSDDKDSTTQEGEQEVLKGKDTPESFGFVAEGLVSPIDSKKGDAGQKKPKLKIPKKSSKKRKSKGDIRIQRELGIHSI